MAAVHVLDDYYLAITLLITIGYQLFFFAIAFSLKFDKLTGIRSTWRDLVPIADLCPQTLQAAPISSS